MLLNPDKARSIISGYERSINDALMELASRSGGWFPGRQVLINLLTEIADMRFGEPPYPRPHGFYSGPLFWEVFGLDPVGNVKYRMHLLRYRLAARRIEPEKMTEALRHFHNRFAFACEEGGLDSQGIAELLNEFDKKVGDEE